MKTENAKTNQTLVENSMNTQLSNWFLLYSKAPPFPLVCERASFLYIAREI